VRVLDLDGDHRGDLVVTNPPAKGAIGGKGSLDLYFAEGTR
jgi:FG-GAP repeat